MVNSQFVSCLWLEEPLRTTDRKCPPDLLTVYGRRLLQYWDFVFFSNLSSAGGSSFRVSMCYWIFGILGCAINSQFGPTVALVGSMCFVVSNLKGVVASLLFRSSIPRGSSLAFSLRFRHWSYFNCMSVLFLARKLSRFRLQSLRPYIAISLGVYICFGNSVVFRNESYSELACENWVAIASLQNSPPALTMWSKL